MTYALVLDSVFANHRTPPGHPERPERLLRLLRDISAASWFSRLKRLDPVRAEEKWISAVHSREHLERIQHTAGSGGRHLDADTFAGGESFEVAMKAAGAAVELVRCVLSGQAQNGFAALRPPGHHAESRRPMGFCLFNNAAVAAQWAIDHAGLERVAVVDFDVHHGNGTQEIFYARSDVLYLSSHQYPFYPGTGHFSESGTGAGRGCTVNFPIGAGAGNHFLCRVFEQLAAPVLIQYRPQLIIVSAGYDAHRDDPLGGMGLDRSGFGFIVDLLNRVAAAVSRGRIAYLLEGGYDLQALSESVQCTITTTLDPTSFEIVETQVDQADLYVRQMREVLSPEWDVSPSAGGLPSRP